MNIEQVISAIQPDLCEKVMENLIQQIHSCMSLRGGHLYDVVFHK